MTLLLDCICELALQIVENYYTHAAISNTFVLSAKKFYLKFDLLTKITEKYNSAINKMKNKIKYLLLLLLFNSSCFLYYTKQQSIDKRLKTYKNKIQKSDTSKINFNGFYFSTFKNPSDSTKEYFNGYKFYRNGKVLNFNGSFNHKITKNDTGNISKGIWMVYYIKDNYVFIDTYNPYNGYYLRRGYFDKDNKEILFTDEINSFGHLLNKVTAVYKLDVF